MTDDTRERLRRSIDIVEAAYEFFLAYAAQGLKRKPDGESRVSDQLAQHVEGMAGALEDLPVVVRAIAVQEKGPVAEALRGFVEAVETDALRAGAALALVRAQEFASSQLVDNLNASVHVRTLLTDLFLVDEALGLAASGSAGAEAADAPADGSGA